MPTRSPRLTPFAFNAPTSMSTRWPSSSKVKRFSPSQTARRSGYSARARGRMCEIGNIALFPFEFRLALLLESLHPLLVIFGENQDALPKPLDVAAGVHVGVEAKVDHVLAHAHGEGRLVEQAFGIRIGFL